MGGFVLISGAEIQGVTYRFSYYSKKYPEVAAKRTQGLLDINKTEKGCKGFCRKIFFLAPLRCQETLIYQHF
jgi:hypothetical protein